MAEFPVATTIAPGLTAVESQTLETCPPAGDGRAVRAPLFPCEELMVANAY